jgi:hypothetical protein
MTFIMKRELSNIASLIDMTISVDHSLLQEPQ